MPLVKLRRIRQQTMELVRSFYESMLMLSLCLLLQWNQWHVVLLLCDATLLQELSIPQTLNWSTIFFTMGLLLTLIEYRPKWLKRCAPRMRKMLLLLELLVVLFVVDYVLLSIWQPLFNIFDQALHALGHSNRPWSQFIFHYWPGLSTWLINDAFYVLRFAVSLLWFLLAVEEAAPKWRRAIDFLLLGQLPKMKAKPRNARRIWQQGSKTQAHAKKI